MSVGVYKILNIKNDKFYIGSTSTIGFEKRWKKHILDLNNNCHHSVYLQRSWNKYGPSKFEFEIVEKCKPKDCLVREQYYLDTLNPNYNMCKNAGSTLGYKFPKSYCLKLEKIRRGKNNPFFGKHHTKITKEKIKLGLRGKVEGKNNGMYGKGFKLTGRKNGSFKGDYKFYHKKHGVIKISQLELTKKFKLEQSAVSRICNGQRKSHSGWQCIGKI